jgi:hypothetical protein
MGVAVGAEDNGHVPRRKAFDAPLEKIGNGGSLMNLTLGRSHGIRPSTLRVDHENPVAFPVGGDFYRLLLAKQVGYGVVELSTDIAGGPFEIASSTESSYVTIIGSAVLNHIHELVRRILFEVVVAVEDVKDGPFLFRSVGDRGIGFGRVNRWVEHAIDLAIRALKKAQSRLVHAEGDE